MFMKIPLEKERAGLGGEDVWCWCKIGAYLRSNEKVPSPVFQETRLRVCGTQLYLIFVSILVLFCLYYEDSDPVLISF